MFPDVFSIAPINRGFPDLLSRGLSEQQFVASPGQLKWLPLSYAKAYFWTISLAPLDALAIVAVHGALPILLVWDLLRRVRRREPVLPPGTYCLVWATIYGLVVFNALDAGENMRFRLSVEPSIIALTATCVAVRWRAAIREWFWQRAKRTQRAFSV